MDLAYAAADFALCRGGAMTCAELTAVGLPAAYVPLPHGNGEQRLNALPIVQRGGGLLVDDAELTADWIKTSLLPVLTNIDQVAGMSEAAAAMGRKDADRWLAKAVIDIVAAEAAGRATERGKDPAAGRPPTPRPAPAPSPAPAGQWASPAPQPPAPAAEEPGSLFTPRTTRHQQGAGGAQQPGPGGPQQPGLGSRSPQPTPRPAPAPQPQPQPPLAPQPPQAPSARGRLPQGSPRSAASLPSPNPGPGRHRQARS
jgi:Glycosyltransferase family 28 C-terminal domain